MIRFEHVTITYADAPGAGAARRRPHHPRGRAVPGRRAAPDPASRRCSARSTGSCRTSPAATSPAGSSSTGATRSDHPPRDLADVVGVVGQDPLAGFVTDTVEEELAYAMEQLAVPGRVMRKRVEETLDLLGIAELRDRAAAHALGRPAAARRDRLGAHRPPADPRARRADLGARPDRGRGGAAAITRLVHDLGITVVMAEHRLERVVQYADRVVLLGATARRRLAAAERARRLAARAARRAARPPGRLGSAAAVRARRPPPGRGRSASGSTAWSRRPPTTVDVVDGPHAPGSGSTAAGSWCATATSSPSAASTSTCRAASRRGDGPQRLRASRRCCGPCTGAAAGRRAP